MWSLDILHLLGEHKLVTEAYRILAVCVQAFISNSLTLEDSEGLKISSNIQKKL